MSITVLRPENYMNSLFDLHPLLILLVALALELVFFALGMVALAYLHRTHRKDASSLPVAPFFVSVTTAWALFSGFLAADIWAAHHSASESAQTEYAALTKLHSMSRPDMLNLPKLSQAVQLYTEQVKAREWAANHNEIPDQAVETALHQMRIAILDAIHAGTPAPMVQELLQSIDELRQSRTQRLSIGMHHSDASEWLIVILLALLSHIAIAAVHGDRPRAARKAMAIFGGAVVICFWGLAIHANPYAGAAALQAERITPGFSPEPLRN